MLVEEFRPHGNILVLPNKGESDIRHAHERFRENVDEPDMIRRWVDGSPPASVTVFFPDHNPRYLQHPQFSRMAEAFSVWATATGDLRLPDARQYGKVPTRKVYGEGSVPEISGKGYTEQSSLQSERGEVALLALWASWLGIPVDSYEPSHAALADGLKTQKYGGSSRDNIFYYLIARNVRQVVRSIPNDIPTHLRQQHAQEGINKKILLYQNALMNWQNFEFSLPHFLQIHTTNYPNRDLNLLDVNFFLSETTHDVTKRPQTPIQYIAEMTSIYREDNAVRVFRNDLKEGCHVFGILGEPHRQRFGQELTRHF